MSEISHTKDFTEDLQFIIDTVSRVHPKPDYWITPSIDDMSRGADPVLDYARSLADRVRN